MDRSTTDTALALNFGAGVNKRSATLFTHPCRIAELVGDREIDAVTVDVVVEVGEVVAEGEDETVTVTEAVGVAVTVAEAEAESVVEGEAVAVEVQVGEIVTVEVVVLVSDELTVTVIVTL